MGRMVPKSGGRKQRPVVERQVFACILLPGKRQSAGYSFLFVPEKEAKRARRSDAAAAGWGCGPRPRDAATLRRPTQALGGLSKEGI